MDEGVVSKSNESQRNREKRVNGGIRGGDGGGLSAI